MELMQIMRILLRRWWLILIPVAITAVIVAPDLLNRSAAVGGYSTMIRFSAAQVLDAVPRPEGDYQDIWLASELTVRALTGWAQTSSFTQEVAEKVAEQGVEIDPATLSLQADSARSIGQIFISWPDEQQLRTIVQATIDILKTRNHIYFRQLGDQPAQVTVLDEPRIVPVPAPITSRLAPFIRLGMGLLAGIGLAFLAHYLDPTVHRREEVEALGLPVITAIPPD